MAKKITSKEFYELVKKEMDILRLAAFGMDMQFINIVLFDNGGFHLDIYRKEDGKTSIDTVRQIDFKSKLMDEGEKVIE